jgi:hypothetical protein
MEDDRVLLVPPQLLSTDQQRMQEISKAPKRVTGSLRNDSHWYMMLHVYARH